MVNYSNGKIYKIEPIVEHPEEDIYIGSTTKQYLSQRMDEHRGSYKKWKYGKLGKTMVFDIFDKYGVENCRILLLESVNANSKDELIAREGHYIRTLKCVNKKIEGITKKEQKQLYYQKHYDKIQTHKRMVCVCEICNSNYNRNSKSRHEKTKKHLTNLEKQNKDPQQQEDITII
jgi:ribosome-interacting GTPase 1